jgi:CPA2 family monovalent cation:H+ antiporter-2
MPALSPPLLIIINIAVAVGVALIGGLVAHRLRQSPIIGYLLAGMIVGPFTAGMVVEHEQITTLAEVGVIFLMFALGIEFSINDLLRIKGPAIVGTIAQVLLTIAGGWAFGRLCGWSSGQALFFGGVISVSSTMVILKALMSRGEVASNHGRLILGMLVVQDLAVVLLILLLPRLAAPGIDDDKAALALIDLVTVALKAGGFIALTLILGARVVPRFMNHVAMVGSSELFLLTAVFLALGSAGASAWMGLSPALGAFLAGLMLTETELEHRILADVVPMRDLFATLFFVSMGMLVNVGYVMANLPLILGVALFIIALKALVTTGVLLPFRLGGKTIMFTGLGMISIGEFSYVLAQAGLAADAITPEIYNLVVASSLITICLTPGAFWVAPRVDKKIASWPLLRRFFAPERQIQINDDLLEAPHAIVLGYGRVGKRVARGLRQAGVPVVVIEQDLQLVHELQRDRHAAIYGDASYPFVLEAARPQSSHIIVVTLPDFGATRQAVKNAHRLNPEAIIVARASRAEQDAKLREAGASAVVVPELAGAFTLLQETLLLLGVRSEAVFTGLTSLQLADESTPAQSEASPTTGAPPPKG